jgi:cytochrome c551/c552
MPKRGCLNCHFFSVDSIASDGSPVTESVDAKYRDKEAITEFLNRRRPFRVSER